MTAQTCSRYAGPATLGKLRQGYRIVRMPFSVEGFRGAIGLLLLLAILGPIKIYQWAKRTVRKFRERG